MAHHTPMLDRHGPCLSLQTWVVFAGRLPTAPNLLGTGRGWRYGFSKIFCFVLKSRPNFMDFICLGLDLND
jgi:hypothetical protein